MLLVKLCLVTVVFGVVCGADEWWRHASFYQIYPRSFKDSDGDGIGDLNGITSKLPYLKEIGIHATWLSPIFKSPMADFGYDIADFFDIQPEYGTMEDFENLIKTAKEIGIRIILDFVPNHSSDENEWFTKSVNKESGFEDFYVWHPGFEDPNNSSNRIPPNNWIQAFRGSAWEWNEKRQEFYLHQFAVKQPDLNYRSPNVVAMMKSVLTFWLDKGVDGFRIDTVPSLFEDAELRDEPLSGATDDPEDPGYLNHIYTYDLPETLEILYQWHEHIENYTQNNGGDVKILLTEAWSNLTTLESYYGNGERNGSQIPFNFQLIVNLHNDSNAFDYENVVNSWLKIVPRHGEANWVLGNHDRNRVATRMGINRADGLNMLTTTLPGVSVTYNGEEIGMTDVWISWEDSVDPSACNSNPDIYESLSRDPERTPFQWDSSTSAGFSTNNHTWLPVSPLYEKVNVEAQIGNPRSHLNIFKQLMRMRSLEVLQHGETKVKALNKNVLAVHRHLPRVDNEDEEVITVFNVQNHYELVDLNELTHQHLLKVAIVSGNSRHILGQLVSSHLILLQPYEALVLTAGVKA